MIDDSIYQLSNEAKQDWFKFREYHIRPGAPSVQSFIAGWNIAKQRFQYTGDDPGADCAGEDADR